MMNVKKTQIVKKNHYIWKNSVLLYLLTNMFFLQ